MDSSDWQRVVVHGFNDNSMVVPNKTILELFIEQAGNTPNATAVEYEGTQMSYMELMHCSIIAMTQLQESGVQANDCVAIMMPRSFEFMVGLFGILMSQCAFVPIDTSLPAQRIEWMLEDTSSSHIFVTQTVSMIVPSSFAGRICFLFLDDIKYEVVAPAMPPVFCKPDDLIYVLYASGSTGRPKGVMIEHRSVVNFVTAMIPIVSISITDRWFQWFSPSFDPSIMDYFLPFLSGASLILWQGQDFAAAIKTTKATMTGITPSALSTLDPKDYAPLRFITPCGEQLPLQLGQTWAFSRRILNGYGPTEATIYASTHVVTPQDTVMSIGRPLPNYRCLVLDPEMKPVNVNVEGELYLGGAGTARGYLNRPDLTEERFLRNPFDYGDRLYKTGDLASWTSDGKLICHGRIDSQVKLRGQRLEVGEIESVACEHEGVEEAAAVVVDKGTVDARLVLFFTQRLQTPVSTQRLVQHLQGRLAAYMVPSHIFSLIQMPRSGSGKLDRNALATRIDVDMGGDLHEIDAVLESHGSVASAATVMYQGKLISLVQSKPHTKLLDTRTCTIIEKELTALCRIKLHAHAIPKEFVIQFMMPKKAKVALRSYCEAKAAGVDYICLLHHSVDLGVRGIELEVVGGIHVPLQPLPNCLKSMPYDMQKQRKERKESWINNLVYPGCM